MFVKSRIGKAAVVLCLVTLLALTSLISVSAAIIGDKSSTLTGQAGSFSLYATVDLTGSVYTYNYELTYQSAGLSNQIHYVGVGNPENEYFYDASNTLDFWDPEWWENDLNIEWADGFMSVGQTVTFSYQSLASPNWEVDVYAYAAGSHTSTGKTVGMSSAVPEPSAFVGLAMALMGVAPFVRKRL